jgi:hypothetical protein
MADTLAPGGILMRICPMRLHRWVSLCETAVYSWLDDRAPTMGAAIAYYTVFSLAPMLVMVIAIAGLAFGQKAAEGALETVVDERVGGRVKAPTLPLPAREAARKIKGRGRRTRSKRWSIDRLIRSTTTARCIQPAIASPGIGDVGASAAMC